MRLPRTLVFPFGYRVAVKVVTPTELADMLDEDECGIDGMWDVDNRTIYLSKSLSARRRRAVLIHEMLHAVADFQHQMLDDGIAKN